MNSELLGMVATIEHRQRIEAAARARGRRHGEDSVGRHRGLHGLAVLLVGRGRAVRPVRPSAPPAGVSLSAGPAAG